MQLVLFSKILINIRTLTFKLENNFLNYKISCTATITNKNSASVVDNATVGCFFNFQETQLLKTLIKLPLTDLSSFLLAKSASAKTLISSSLNQY